MSATCLPRSCLNGGTCLIVNDEIECSCPSNFYGDTCQNNVAMAITFVLIGIALLLAIVSCLIIALCQRFREEQERPRIINRIISVRSRRRPTKIDKSKIDLPPAYDDVSFSGNREEETEVNGANRHEEENVTECQIDVETLLTNDEHVSGDESGVDLSIRVADHDEATEPPESSSTAHTDEANQNERRTEESEENAAPPPGYGEVQDNRASKRVYLQTDDESESGDRCTNPAEDDA